MRLLSSSKSEFTQWEFTEFFDSDIPEYAILSHRWSSEEVTYEDYLNKKHPRGTGIDKIQQCCQLAKREGYKWVWIDTCCIDKKSSAELSEAINSMYRWYQGAQVCYAYLNDVFANTQGGYSAEDFGPWEESFKNSTWFTRGWTLQELLAPKRVHFLDQHWQLIGTKKTLAERVSLVTGIDVQVCQGTKSIKSCCVAQKMSWASKRTTSKIEDMAYCLLGVFDINMPLLYGEGAKAFLRLQEEIIRISDDESIFAWQSGFNDRGCLLAHSPSEFLGADNVRIQHFDTREPYLITNRGLRMNVPLLESPDKYGNTQLLPLSCSKDRQSPLAVVIQKGDMSNDRYVRQSCVELKTVFGVQTWSFEELSKRVIDVHLRPRW